MFWYVMYVVVFTKQRIVNGQAVIVCAKCELKSGGYLQQFEKRKQIAQSIFKQISFKRFCDQIGFSQVSLCIGST